MVLTMNKKYKINKKEKNKKSEIEINCEISAEEFKKYTDKEIKEIQKDFEAKGFRKGNVPEDIIKKEMGIDQILNQSANSAIQNVYLEIMEEIDEDIMGLPQISLTKIAEGNPLEFKIKIGLFPKAELPNYKKLAKELLKTENVEIKEEEVQKVIDDIIQMYDKNIKDKEESSDTEKSNEPKKKTKLNDEFVKKIGKFENVEDFKNKIRENVKLEKQNAEKMKGREELAKELIEKTKVTIPEIVLNQEIQSSLSRLVNALKKQGTTIEEYLEKTKKTEKDFFEENKKHVENQIKMRLILEAIAREEDIKVTEKEILEQLSALKQKHPDADEENLRNHISVTLANEKVLNLLEEQSK